MTQATWYTGDALTVLKTLPSDSVDIVMSSPPFLALRSYLPADHPDKDKEIGSESTPGEFVDTLVEIIEECRRVLTPYGSLCLELGDTYSGSGGAGDRENKDAVYIWEINKPGTRSRVAAGPGWPLPKSLTLVPEIVRFTLAYGFNPLTGRETEQWRIRNVVRWVRPNPPVGALGDKFRPATSDLLVAAVRADRWFDLDAVRTEHKYPDYVDKPVHVKGQTETSMMQSSGTIENRGHPAGAPPLDWWNITPKGYKGAHYAVYPSELCVTPIKAMCPERVCLVCGEPSRRITNNQRIIEADDTTRLKNHGDENPNWNGKPPPIGWEYSRETIGWSDCGHGKGCVQPTFEEREYPATYREDGKLIAQAGSSRVMVDSGGCSNDHWRPGVVLDPFAGTGTTLAVATGHSRDAIGIDLDPRNLELARQRLGLFLTEAAPI